MFIRTLWVSVLCSVLAFGCDRPKPKTSTPTDDIRILALGDSYTIGQSVTPDQRWPVQLAAVLRQSGIPIAEPTIIARTGWTSGELITAIDETNPSSNYDLVTLLIGVNNEYRGGSPEVFRSEFRKLLSLATRYAGGRVSRVVVVSIPDWSVTPFGKSSARPGVAAEIDTFNSVCRDETAKAGARFVDITPVSRQGTTQPSLQAEDGLHPSGEQYGLWVKQVEPVVKQILIADGVKKEPK